ncbi:hypothetical protein [Bacillus weihaiensis]|nr:hypothetical protein [Bacillus weihaiensis]
MNVNSMKELKSENLKTTTSGLKVIEWNVSDCTEKIYAVVTPVKNSDN